MARVPDPQLREWWQRLIDSFDSQSDTVARYCRQNDVSTASFYRWQRKLRSATSPRFLKVDVRNDRSARDELPIASIHFPDGVRLDLPVGDPRLLYEAIHALTAEVRDPTNEEVES
jgi:hypothetical protein